MSSAFGQGLLPPAAPGGAVVPCPLLPACHCLLLHPHRCPLVMTTLYHFCKPPIGSSPRTLCLPLRIFWSLCWCVPLGFRWIFYLGVGRAGSKHTPWWGSCLDFCCRTPILPTPDPGSPEFRLGFPVLFCSLLPVQGLPFYPHGFSLSTHIT